MVSSSPPLSLVPPSHFLTESLVCADTTFADDDAPSPNIFITVLFVAVESSRSSSRCSPASYSKLGPRNPLASKTEKAAE